MFRIEITDDDGADPYFLYLWSVSEEEFHELKQQQRLLVDFMTFPSNLIELLECCLKDSKAPRETLKQQDESDDEESIASDERTGQEPPDKTKKQDSASGHLGRSQGPVPLR